MTLWEPTSSPTLGFLIFEIGGGAEEVDNLGRGLFRTPIKDSKTEYGRIRTSHPFSQINLAEKEVASRQSGRQKTQERVEVAVLTLNFVRQASRLEAQAGF